MELEWTDYKTIDIRQLTEKHLLKPIVVRGRVHKIRVTGNIIFLILRYQTSSIQVIIPKKKLGKDAYSAISAITVESVVDCYGSIRASPVKIEATSYHNFEMELDRIQVISAANPVPFGLDDANEVEESFRSTVGNHTRLENRWLDLRTPLNSSIFKIQSAVTQYFREYLLTQGFIEIHSPKLIGSASEGGAEVFKLDYFGKPAFLAQSPQLYKQLAINADFDRVFEIGPVFRAENSLTRRHMCEFIGLDLEMALSQGQNYREVQGLLWKTLVYIFDMLKFKSGSEIAYIRSKAPFDDPLYPKEPLIIPFAECVQLLRDDGKEQGDFEDFSSENERRLGEIVKGKYNSDLFIIEKYPTSVRPFYTMVNQEDTRYTNSWDIIFRCTEISSGAQREHNYNTLMNRVIEKGVNPETLKYYLESFSHGSMPHGGSGFGLERIVSLYLGLDSVKSASLCPRDPKRLFP